MTLQLLTVVRARPQLIKAAALSQAIAASAGTSRELIRQVLRQLAEEGLMDLRGKGRAARWHPMPHP